MNPNTIFGSVAYSHYFALALVLVLLISSFLSEAHISISSFFRCPTTFFTSLTLDLLPFVLNYVVSRYNYTIVANISTKGTTDSIFFQHRESLYGSPEDMFIMSLNNNDKLRFITAPEYVHTLAEKVIRR